MENDRIAEAHLLLDALNFAALRHRSQRRKGRNGAPYINHLIEVAHILALHGVDDADILRAALLHDAVEDAEVTLDELRDRYGRRVAQLVQAVTDDVSQPVWKRKLSQIEGASQLPPGAQAIRVADKISNLRGILSSPPPNWSLERKVSYYGWAAQVVDACVQAPSGLRATFAEVHAVGLAALYATSLAHSGSSPRVGPEGVDLLAQLEVVDPVGRTSDRVVEHD